MHARCRSFAAAAVLIAASIARAEPSRTFFFDYDATITQLTPGAVARIWIPVPRADDAQTIERVASNLPADTSLAREPKAGNEIASFSAAADARGEIPVRVRYRVTRREVGVTPATRPADPSLLQADALVPIGGAPATLLMGRVLPSDPLAAGRVLYDLVNDRMQYRKDQPGWGRGDATWACESRFGNCTDFHSLFISLARTSDLPAGFEIGFGLPATRGRGDVAGYHCWATFYADGHGWVPVDISEANKHPDRRDYFFGHLDADRVTFTSGRDLTLVPPQAGPPLNFFVYPYAEVAGVPWPAENLTKRFAYEDVAAAATRP